MYYTTILAISIYYCQYKLFRKNLSSVFYALSQGKQEENERYKASLAIMRIKTGGEQSGSITNLESALSAQSVLYWERRKIEPATASTSTDKCCGSQSATRY
jgi:hypothetical protein